MFGLVLTEPVIFIHNGNFREFGNFFIKGGNLSLEKLEFPAALFLWLVAQAAMRFYLRCQLQAGPDYPCSWPCATMFCGEGAFKPPISVNVVRPFLTVALITGYCLISIASSLLAALAYIVFN